MSRLQKDSTIPSVASMSQEDQESRTLKVTLLSCEWRSSSDGDLSTVNRELAIQLAKHPNVDVSILLPNCSGEDRSSAESHNVKLIEADKAPGVEPVLCLSSPPINHTMDCVIGHGVHLGRLVPFIKRNPNYSHCKWIQVVHSAPEEDGMYKNISEGEKRQKTEIQLCKMADQVITIGPKLAETYKCYLCPVKQEEKVFDLTPSIFSEFLEVRQATEERRKFCLLVIGSGDSCEDFNVKGYDIAAKAIAELKDESYKLKFVCPAGGKGDILAKKLLHHGISRNQLIVRSFDDSRKVLADLFCEVDLAIMPSRTEGFGTTALEALSAGLPVLVSGNSGLGEALKKVPFGSQSVVDSEKPKDWAKEIKRVRQKEREVRLSESRFLREKYLEKYSWEEPCKSLVIKMRNLVFGGSEQVICSLQRWQQNASSCKISSNTDPLSDFKRKGYRISNNPGSGNCMFYALSEQLEVVKRVKIHHFELRQSLVQYLREHPKLVDGTDLFHFVDRHKTWDGYLTDMEQDGTWGDHVILWAAANCYQIAIHVISSLPGRSEVIINPDCSFDQSKHLVLGHVYEVHYVSLQPLQDAVVKKSRQVSNEKVTRSSSSVVSQSLKRPTDAVVNKSRQSSNKEVKQSSSSVATQSVKRLNDSSRDMAETLALLIGPSYSADLPTYCGPLRGVANDLKLMKDMLCENGFQPENIKVLEGLLASRARILASLEELSVRAQKGSVVVVYYSGHGHSFDAKQAGYFDEGLIPGDVTREMVDEYHILDTCITGEHFNPYLSKLINKGALVNVIFDCCFSGRMYRGTSEVKNTYTGIKQETQPANPASAPVALPYPVSEFWTPALKSEGWSPHENDNFIFMAACATNERSYEYTDPETHETYGVFTSALVAAIREFPPGQRLSYNMLKSLVRQRMADKKQRQTPQFEGGNMNLILFSFDKAPPPPISFEVKKVHDRREFTYRITLNAGFLQGVVEGVYYIFDTRLTDENQMEDFRVATVYVSHENIHATESTAEVEINSIFHECKVKVGYKARLAKLGSMYYPICIIATELEEKYVRELKLAILMDSLQMFSLREQETPECVKMDVVTIEKRKCWRAIYKGRMIAPDQRIEDGHLMIKNLCKYFRVKFGTRLRDPGHNMLRNVSLKLFKVENVPSYKKNLSKKKELKAQAVQTAEVYEGHPEDYVPNFGAHKVEIAPNSGFRKKYEVVDSSGDAVVIQITNNEEFPIHVCLISYQSDGSIVALYPAAKKGLTSVLRPGESVSEIRRVCLQPETVRLMEEPNVELTRPDGCNDIIMLYATTAEADYQPLFQTPIELSPYLSTRGIDTPDGLGLHTVARFRDALDSEPRSRDAVRDDVRWITIKREFRVIYHPEQTFEQIVPLEY